MVKIGIVGAGKRYKQFYKDILDSLSDKISIVGFVTKSGKIADDIGNYKVYKSITELCNDAKPNFLISVTPYQLNKNMILQACENKCDILVETPVGNISDAPMVLDAISKSGIKAGSVEQWPFLPMECFKKKLIDSGVLGDIHLAENDYRSYTYHAVAQLRNYLGKDANFAEIKGKFKKNYPLDGRNDNWTITIAELDNEKTILYKYSDAYKRVDVRNFKSLRVYGSKGTIISDCILDNDIEKFSIIWSDGNTYHLNINKVYENSNIKEISTVLPNNSIIKWENKFNKFSYEEHQIAIAHHIDSMVNGNVLWSVEDGFKDLQIL
tara:strand:- start:153 stop:1124 length:972 start_codon:yes stop_codon:yes gene_type:complete